MSVFGASPHHPLHLLPRRSPGDPVSSRRRPVAAAYGAQERAVAPQLKDRPQGGRDAAGRRPVLDQPGSSGTLARMRSKGLYPPHSWGGGPLGERWRGSAGD